MKDSSRKAMFAKNQDKKHHKKTRHDKKTAWNCGCDERKRKIKSFLHKINLDKKIKGLIER